MPSKLEVPIFGPASAAAASQFGASRIELNASGSYAVGGLTPSLEELAQLRSLGVPLRVMIRPRGAPISGAKDFIYADDELDAMVRSIDEFKSSGLLKMERGDGFVFGVLHGADDKLVLDIGNCDRLVDAAQPFKTVFHRAFDELVASEVWKGALEELVAAGFNGILTSGGPGNAVDNAVRLGCILEEAGNRIEIIVGGGVRSTVIGGLTRHLRFGNTTRVSWVHSSCLTTKDSEAVDIKEVGAILSELE